MLFYCERRRNTVDRDILLVLFVLLYYFIVFLFFFLVTLDFLAVLVTLVQAVLQAIYEYNVA